MTQQELQTLLNSMSPAEKAGQLAQIPLSACAGGISDPTGPMIRFHLTPEQVVLCGSLICDQEPDAAQYARIVRELRDAHPHHIPPILMRDIIHGFTTVFPIPLALGCTFDEGLAEEMGRLSAREGAAAGVHATFAPMVDVVRDPRWGRCMESPGESTALCGAMGAAMVRGFRGDDLRSRENLAACVKHYAAYGLCQAGMEYAPADCSRTEMYNVYLPPFKAALDAGCDMIMPSFIAVDRVPCVCNEWLLKDILRRRWGSDAMVISDYADPMQLTIHGAAEDLKEAAELCMNAGLDMDMMSFAYLAELPGLLAEGKVKQADVDAAVMRVLQLKNKLGLFEVPVKNDDSAVQKAAQGLPETRQAALAAAQKSCVLLKNDGILPLKAGTKLALAGSHADTGKILGGWSMDGDVSATETLTQAFAREHRVVLTDPEKADVILYAAGEDEFETGEGGSRTRPWLKEEEMAELRRYREKGKQVVLVLFIGRPFILTQTLPLCDGVLCAWFPGSEGAEAVRSLILGDANPSGHASMTFPRALGQVPIHHDKISACRRWEPHKYSNRYVDEQNEPLFPFGFGLSYTQFALSGHRVSADTLGDGAQVSVTVTNTGSRFGETVVQLYARVPYSPVIRAVRSLIGWKRIALEPGESAEVTLPVTKQMLRICDAFGEPVALKGQCHLAIGLDSTAPFTLSLDCSD